MYRQWIEDALGAAAAEERVAADHERRAAELLCAADAARKRAKEERARAAELTCHLTSPSSPISPPNRREQQYLFSKYAAALEANETHVWQAKLEQQQLHMLKESTPVPSVGQLSEEVKAHLIRKYGSMVTPTSWDQQWQQRLYNKVKEYHAQPGVYHAVVSPKLWSEMQGKSQPGWTDPSGPPAAESKGHRSWLSQAASAVDNIASAAERGIDGAVFATEHVVSGAAATTERAIGLAAVPIGAAVSTTGRAVGDMTATMGRTIGGALSTTATATESGIGSVASTSKHAAASVTAPVATAASKTEGVVGDMTATHRTP